MHCPREMDMFEYTTSGIDARATGQASAKLFELRASGQFRYRLKAVVEHVGSRLHGGHFICYVRVGDIWNLCDDHKISVVRVIGCPPSATSYVASLGYAARTVPDGLAVCVRCTLRH